MKTTFKAEVRCTRYLESTLGPNYCRITLEIFDEGNGEGWRAHEMAMGLSATHDKVTLVMEVPDPAPTLREACEAALEAFRYWQGLDHTEEGQALLKLRAALEADDNE